MTERPDSPVKLRSEELNEWVRENQEAILAWAQTVRLRHYYRRMLLAVSGLALTASSLALAAVLLDNPGVFVVDGVPNAELLYWVVVGCSLLGTVVGVVVALREYLRRTMSTRAATIRAIQIVRDDPTQAR